MLASTQSVASVTKLHALSCEFHGQWNWRGQAEFSMVSAALSTVLGAWRGMAKAASGSPSVQRAMRSYRYTFLNHPDDERSLASFVLLSDSDETASDVAKDLLVKSDATCVEVWSD